MTPDTATSPAQSTSASSTSPAGPAVSSTGLSPGAVVPIAVGVSIGGAIALGAVVLIFWRGRKLRRQRQQNTVPAAGYSGAPGMPPSYTESNDGLVCPYQAKSQAYEMQQHVYELGVHTEFAEMPGDARGELEAVQRPELPGHNEIHERA